MAKRFTDTNKYKKSFMRNLPGAYKLLWDFLYHDCDHAGIWIVDFDVAQMYIGRDMEVSKDKAISMFNDDEVRIVELQGGKKWFIPGFIEFQYGLLSEKNRAHNSVILILKKFDLINQDLSLKIKNKPLTSPLQGGKDMDKDKEQDMDKDFGKSENLLAPGMVKDFLTENPEYPIDTKNDYTAVREISEKIKIYHKIEGRVTDETTLETIRLKWKEIVLYIRSDTHLSRYSLSQISKHFQSVIQSMLNGSDSRKSSGSTGGEKLGTSAARIKAAREW